jgi:hypothetical protein
VKKVNFLYTLRENENTKIPKWLTTFAGIANKNPSNMLNIKPIGTYFWLYYYLLFSTYRDQRGKNVQTTILKEITSISGKLKRIAKNEYLIFLKVWVTVQVLVYLFRIRRFKRKLYNKRWRQRRRRWCDGDDDHIIYSESIHFLFEIQGDNKLATSLPKSLEPNTNIGDSGLTRLTRVTSTEEYHCLVARTALVLPFNVSFSTPNITYIHTHDFVLFVFHSRLWRDVLF